MKKVSCLLLLFLVIGSACKKKEPSEIQPSGSWLESSHQTDTMVFDPLNGLMTLNRGKEMRGGYLLPKYHSGVYTYKVEQDSISLHWLLSSSWGGNKYYFKEETLKETLKVQNFFVDSLAKSVVLNFTKIK